MRTKIGNKRATRHWITVTGIVALCLACSPIPYDSGVRARAQEPQQAEPASAADLEALAPISLLFVEPAKEPVPALRYRFYPNPRDLKPGSATPYFQRAMVQYLRKPADVQEHINQFHADYEDGKAKTAIADELASFENVFVELKKFGDCEDLHWDDRWRDLRGAALWEAMLPEFQEARALGRLIELKARQHLKKREFDAAFAWIRVGFRLAEYLGHGDTIVQKLVAISRCQAMNYVVREAISTPGCPNLYWALACLPEPFVSMRRSIDIECLGIEYSFPVLYNAESKDLGREQWQELWSETFETFASLKRMDANGNPDLAKQLELTFQRSMNADLGKARKSILSNGYSKEHVSSMCSEQLVALNALCEVRQRASQTAKASFLPSPYRERELEKAKAEQEKYMAENPTTICALLQFVSTAADAVNQTETKQICFVRQLMTLEAIRMHAAEHGSPPESLNDLGPVPALPNPFDGNPFVYKSIKEAAAWHIILNCGTLPNGVKWLPEQDFWIQMK